MSEGETITVCVFEKENVPFARQIGTIRFYGVGSNSPELSLIEDLEKLKFSLNLLTYF